jgi:peptide/nickel transport system substrate-binding protein
LGIGQFPSEIDPRAEIDFFNELWGPAALDPALTGYIDTLEVLRCCLARTLMAFPGLPTRDGGGIVQPDLAAGMPEVSDDGLTWTFRLKAGIQYGPPHEELEVRAQDVITALERSAPNIGSYYFGSVIEGYASYATGDAPTITGLEAPDDLTLRVHLTTPSGDLGDRFSTPASTPIPPQPAEATARFGVATGHDHGYGAFLVSTGPYMLAGSEAVDFTLPPDERQPASGWQPGSSIELVRNPSWRAADDPMRGALVDRIEISFHDSLEDASAALDEGTIDLVWYTDRPPQAPAAQVEAYRADPARGFVSVEPADAYQAIWLNLAVPPLDDVHVRRAMNLVLDKAAIQALEGGPDVADVVGHIGLNSQENDLLLDYDPYGRPGQAGDVDAARAEIALSRYDSDGDGRCDDPSCAGLAAFVHDNPDYGAPADLIAEDFEQIGIVLDLHRVGTSAIFDPATRAPMALTIGWQKAFPNASDWFSQFAAGGPSSLGRSREELAELGYPVTEVPNADSRIDACLAEIGAAQLRCWADLDQYLMENVIPWVPYASWNMINIVPARIVRYSFSQATTLPALDQIALEPSQ